MSEKINTIDAHYMRRCFQLAQLGEGYVAPNPKVGAVLVYNQRIIGEGYHKEYGQAHAEVNCIKSVGDTDRHLIAQSTLYVSLEPCSHFGKTPPCVDLILQHKIPRVVISVKDIFEKVNGSGIQKLKQHGVEVETDVLKEEGEILIRHFLHFHKNKRPYITLKWAQSADGYIGAIGKRIAISHENARYFLHQQRAEHQAILVGKNTVLNDNPVLTVRYAYGKNPLRIVLCEREEIPNNYEIFNTESPTIFIARKEHTDLISLLQFLYQKQVISILVEGGEKILNAFIKKHLWDEAFVYYAAKNIETSIPQKVKAPNINGKIADTKIFYEDRIVRYIANN